MHAYVGAALLTLNIGCSHNDSLETPESNEPSLEQGVDERRDATLVQRQDSAFLSTLDSEIPKVDLGIGHDSTKPVSPVDQFVSISDADVETNVTTDMTAPNSFECPSDATTSMCLFGETTRMLENNENFEITPVLILTRVAEGSESYEPYVLQGFQCEGLFHPMSLAEAIELTDDGIEIRRIIHRVSSQTFTWYRFYMGDTEVGFIFNSYGQISALIGDQDIHTCQIPTNP